MLGDVVTWWKEQLLGLLPDAVRRWADPWANVLLVESAAETVVLIRRQRGVESRIGRFDLDESGLVALRRLVGGGKLPVVLRLPAGALLEKVLTLPLQAERGLSQVLRYEMDRITPFGPGTVFWGWTVERRDRVRARLHVLLFLIPRVELAPLIDRLGRSAITLKGLEAPAPGGARHVPLESDEVDRSWSMRRRSAVAAGLCAALGVSAIGLPFILQGLALAHVQRSMAALQPAVTEVETLRRTRMADASGGNVIATERARVGDPLAALAAVTKTLSDGTFLTDLTLAQRHLTMTGQSREAARIIPALAGEPDIRNPGFSAPVTRSATGALDLFSIHAEILP